MKSSQSDKHQSVLLEECMDALNIQSDGNYIDGTFGRGGHSCELLKRLNEHGKLLAIDKDADAIEFASKYFSNERRLVIRQSSFTQMKQIIQELGWYKKINGVLLDLGVSSPQLDNPLRGFSFRQDGPLDMRMDTSKGLTAAQWIAKADEADIARVLKVYGEERFSRRIAKAIIDARKLKQIETTSQLSKIVADANPKWEKGKDPATRSFQAIRIYINQELGELEELLNDITDFLAPMGRLVIISFHSLEDRIVKRFINKQSKGDDFPKGFPVTIDQLNPKLNKIGKAIKPGKKEIQNNLRSRSAIMRVAEKLP